MSRVLPLPGRVAGNLALDLANTISWRGTPRQVDHLTNAEAILAWAVESGLADAAMTLSSAECRRLVNEVHRLRKAIETTGSAIAQKIEPPAAALDVVRDIAAKTLARATLVGAPARLEFSGVDTVVGPVVWAAIDLLRTGDLGRLKQCPPNDCCWLFLDVTKNGSRRWCDMGTCGNRAKKLSTQQAS